MTDTEFAAVLRQAHRETPAERAERLASVRAEIDEIHHVEFTDVNPWER